MAVNLSPVGGAAAQFFDNNGKPLPGGKLYTYAAGTTTPQVTYTSISGITAHPNPIILDSAARVPTGEIWLTAGLSYKFVLYTSTNTLIASWDNIFGIGDISETILAEVKIALTPIIYTITSNGSTTIYNLANAPINENSTQIYINGVYQQKNTYSVIGTILTFSEAPPITSTIEVNYV
jgi:hypothetical protein